MILRQLLRFAILLSLPLGFGLFADSRVVLSHADSTELYFVVGTEAESVVQLALYDEPSSTLISKSTPQLTTAVESFTARILIDGLSPSRRYTVHFFENGTVTQKFSVATAPVSSSSHDRHADSNFVFISGVYGIQDSISSRLANTLSALPADALFLLGNSLPANPNSNYTSNSYANRWAQLQKNLCPIMANKRIPVYPVLGTSDYGSPGADGRFYARIFALEAHRNVWYFPLLHLSLQTPSASIAAIPPSLREASLIRGIPLSTPSESPKAICWSMCRGPVEFFALDCFSFRDKDNGHYLGASQLAWLESALALSDAPIKIIMAGTPILHPLDAPGYFAAEKEEYRRFLARMDTLGVKGILFVTASASGMGELTRVARGGLYPFRELAVGDIHPSNSDRDVPRNYRREPGTLVKVPHFSHLNITDAANGITLKWRILDLSGKEIWSEILFAKDFGLGEISR